MRRLNCKIEGKTKELGVAWMLKAKGQSYEAIPCKIHVYGAIGDLDENASAAIWMLKYNPYDKLRTFLKQYLGYLANSEIPFISNLQEGSATDDFLEKLKKVILGLPFNLGEQVGMSKEETANFLIRLLDGLSVLDIYELGDDVDDNTGDFVAKDLNETFIRVRMNDEYNAGAYTGVCYFRIGSTSRNWTNQIWAFVYDHGNIKKVVVERDAESDGKEGMNLRDVYINNMDREEFLSAERLPFLGSKHTEGIYKTCHDILSQGMYSDLDCVRANSSRIQKICEALKAEHIKLNCETIEAPWATTPRNR